jgi:hypothetical protein
MRLRFHSRYRGSEDAVELPDHSFSRLTIQLVGSPEIGVLQAKSGDIVRLEDVPVTIRQFAEMVAEYLNIHTNHERRLQQMADQHREADTGRYTGIPVWKGGSEEAPTSGRVIGYDQAKQMQGEAFDQHEIGSGWTPVGDDF